MRERTRSSLAILKVENVRSRSIMMHAGGDDRCDQRAALEGSAARIASGVIK